MTEPEDPRPPPSSAEKVALAIVAAALLGFGAYGVATGASSTLLYLISVAVVGALVVWLRRRPLPAFLAIALALDAVAHLAGGLVSRNGDVLYDWSIGPLITSFDTHVLQYDHLVHAYGSFVATLALWVLLVPPPPQVAHRRNLILLCLLAGIGIGAANEVIEFVATLAHRGAYVGGYFNTGWDLMFNALGAGAAALLLTIRGSVVDRPA
jgi:uncharacterized membrane protein YjdF